MTTISSIPILARNSKVKGKTGKGFPYSLPSVGPGADPGVQAVSPQVTSARITGGQGDFPHCGCGPHVIHGVEDLKDVQD